MSDRCLVSSCSTVFLVIAVMLAVCALAGHSEPVLQAVERFAEAPTASTPPVETRLAEARASQAAAEALGDAASTNKPAGVPLQDISTRRALLSRLVRLLEQQLSNGSELEAVKT